MKSELKKRVSVHNVDDVQNSEGDWLITYSESTHDSYIKYTTRGGALWTGLQARVRLGGDCQRKNPTYKGCTNDFEYFNNFMSWATKEYGYLNKEPNGRFWALDKDILIQGNKSYNPDTCLFVPSYINSILVAGSVKNNGLPLGVSEYVYDYGKMFVCQLSHKKQHIRVGQFGDPMDAHRAWQIKKISLIREYATDITLGSKLIGALTANADRIQDDYDNYRETRHPNRERESS